MTRPRSKTPGHILLLGLAPLCILALFVLGWYLEPASEGHGTHTQLGLPPCLSMEVFGLPCPGCGVTTSAALAARGELTASLRTQPLGLLLVVLAALYPLWALHHSLRGRDLLLTLRERTSPRWLLIVAAVVLASWAARLAFSTS